MYMTNFYLQLVFAFTCEGLPGPDGKLCPLVLDESANSRCQVRVLCCKRSHVGREWIAWKLLFVMVKVVYKYDSPAQYRERFKYKSDEENAIHLILNNFYDCDMKGSTIT